MFNSKRTDSINNLADQAADTAEKAILSTQRVANESLNGISGTVESLRQQAAPLLNRASEQASALLQHGVEAVQDGSDKVRAKAARASEYTTNYIKDEPVKAVLIAAATGAALMSLLTLFSRARDRS